MSALKVPTVTEDDLRTFHLTHFGRSLPPESLAAHPSQFLALPKEEDNDGLGYYPDGVKRTLTDEQIAIFRHTEVQTLLRESRRRRAAEIFDDWLQSDESPQEKVTSPSSLEQRLQHDEVESNTGSGASLEPLFASEMAVLPDLNVETIDLDGVIGSDVTRTANSPNTILEATSADNSRNVPKYPGMNNSQRKNMKARRKRKKKNQEERRIRQGKEGKTPRRKAREKDEHEAGLAPLEYDNVDMATFVKDEELEKIDMSGLDDFDGEEAGETGELNKFASGARATSKSARNEVNKNFLWPQIKIEPETLDY